MKAEEIKEGMSTDDKIKAITGDCTCAIEYSSREMIGPDCVYHNFGDDIGNLIAENERLRKALEEITEQFKRVDPLYSSDKKLIEQADNALKQQP